MKKQKEKYKEALIEREKWEFSVVNMFFSTSFVYGMAFLIMVFPLGLLGFDISKSKSIALVSFVVIIGLIIGVATSIRKETKEEKVRIIE